MTKINTLLCDRCGREFLAEDQQTLLALQVVAVRQKDTDEILRYIDLCNQCSNGFLSWFKVK